MGLCGRPANSAACPSDNAAGGRPKYRQLAAPTPVRLPPKGARFRYSSSTSGLGSRRSIWHARTACASLPRTDRRGVGCRRRWTCMAIVLAPRCSDSDVTSCQAAAAALRQSTPPWV